MIRRILNYGLITRTFLDSLSTMDFRFVEKVWIFLSKLILIFVLTETRLCIRGIFWLNYTVEY